MNPDTLLSVDGIWKKYCRDLKRSLIYGFHDIGKEILLTAKDQNHLRDKEFWVLKDINFTLKKGDTIGLLGHNGAGKSTLLKLLNGIVKPTKGSITVNGSMQALIELGGAFNPLLSGRENILISGAILGLSKKVILRNIDEIIEFAELQDFIDAPVGTYSTGMRVRLGFSVAMFIKPDILIIDEVLSVGDIAFQAKSLERVAQIRAAAGGVIFVSHNVNQIKRICTKCLLLDQGEIIAYGDPEEVIEKYIKQQKTRTASNSPLVSTKTESADACGMRLLSLKIIDTCGREIKMVANQPFIFQIDLIIEEMTKDISIDFGFFTSSMQPIVLIAQDCQDLSYTEGRKKIEIRFPSMPLSGGQYFPYLAIVDKQSLRKMIKFMDSIGFTVDQRMDPHSLLVPDIQMRITNELNNF
jgi:ABC-type polysaccharide/polyol phosphate transport system ATPase subunit